MLTYIVRRLLYSIVVLILASMIIFTFVSVSGDPLGYLRTRPNISQQTIQNIEERNHLNDPVPGRVGPRAGHHRGVPRDRPRSARGGARILPVGGATPARLAREPTGGTSGRNAVAALGSAVDGGRPVLVATLALRTGARAGRGSADRRGDRRLPRVPRGSRRPSPTIPSIPRDRRRHRPLTAHRGAQA